MLYRFFLRSLFIIPIFQILKIKIICNYTVHKSFASKEESEEKSSISLALEK